MELPAADGVSEADRNFAAAHHSLALPSHEQLLCLAGRTSDYAALVATRPSRSHYVMAS